jgi:hypothetical protein
MDDQWMISWDDPPSRGSREAAQPLIGKELGDLVGLNFFKHQFSLQY